MTIRFDHSYQRDLPGTFVPIAPDVAPDPALVVLNRPLAAALGLDPEELAAHGAAWFSGAALPPGAAPVALAYAGHQFGGFSPQLGDGRAHLLGEILAPGGARFDLQLKGSGRTPFSRGGDGKAVLGPMLREYLVSEAMAALGVPTTRALAVTLTGERVWREGRQPGAVLARVAASHIRVGTFQFFAARGEGERLAALLSHAAARHWPAAAAAEVPALAFLDAVILAQAELVAQWMSLGFVHGVMNTDNMAVSGETIDYGPCAFMEGYDPRTVFSSIDRGGRYAWANQPAILGWNLARLAETLIPLIAGGEEAAVERLNDRLATIAPRYGAAWLARMRAKLGLPGEEAGDEALVEDLLAAMAAAQADWTLTFARLGPAAAGEGAALETLFPGGALAPWLARWRARLGDDGQGAARRMAGVNPTVIPRNHKVEEALTAATEGDLAPFRALLAAVTDPFAPRPAEAFALPAPTGFGPYVTFCGT